MTATVLSLVASAGWAQSRQDVSPAAPRGAVAVALLSEKGVVEQSLQRSPALLAARQHAQSYRLKADTASALSAPVLKLGSIDSVADASSGTVQRRGTAAIQWSPPRAGEIDAKRARMGADADVARLQADVEAVTVERMARQTYRRLLLLQEQMLTAANAFDFSRRLAQLDAPKQLPARSSDRDTSPMDERSLQLRARQDSLRDEWTIHVARLADLLQEPELRTKGPDDVQFAPFSVEWAKDLAKREPVALSELHAIAVSQRPEMKVLAARCRAVDADAQIKESEGRMALKDVELSYSSSTEARRPVIGVLASITLPMGLSPHGSPAVLASQRRACEAERAALQSSIEQEVTQHQLRYARTMRDLKPGLELALPLQAQAVVNMRALYEQRRASELMLRRVELRQAQQNLIVLEKVGDALQADAALQAALGSDAIRP